MITIFGRPLWYTPPKLISYSFDGLDADKQIFDIYSFSHVTHGILFYFILRALGIQSLMGLYITIILEILWEIIENTEFIINKYRKTHKLYEGDSIVNMVGDIICTIIGYILAYTYPFVSILYTILIEIVLYPYKASLLQLSIIQLFK
jgi:hypothetical protein